MLWHLIFDDCHPYRSNCAGSLYVIKYCLNLLIFWIKFYNFWVQNSPEIEELRKWTPKKTEKKLKEQKSLWHQNLKGDLPFCLADTHFTIIRSNSIQFLPGVKTVWCRTQQFYMFVWCSSFFAFLLFLPECFSDLNWLPDFGWQSSPCSQLVLMSSLWFAVCNMIFLIILTFSVCSCWDSEYTRLVTSFLNQRSLHI